MEPLPDNSSYFLLASIFLWQDRSLWDDLKHCKVPISLVVGESDGKFKAIARQMSSEFAKGSCEIVEIPESGHAVHLENPLAVARALRKFFTGFKEEVPDEVEATMQDLEGR